MEKFATRFNGPEDPCDDNVCHNLIEILVIAFATIPCGEDDCSEMALRNVSTTLIQPGSEFKLRS